MKVSELQDSPEKEKIVAQFGPDADVQELAKSYLGAREKLTSTRRVPDQAAPQEEWSKFYDTLGRPEAPDRYEMPDAPESLKPTLEKLRQVAWEKGLTQDQFKALASQAGAVTVDANSRMAEARKEWEAKIREQHGPKADERLALADNALRSILGSDPRAQELMKQTGLDRNPALVNLLVKAGTAMTNDPTPGGGSPPQNLAGPSPVDLFKEGVSIMGTDAFKKGDRHPENKLAQARLVEINLALQALGYRGLADPRFTKTPSVTLPSGVRIA